MSHEKWLSFCIWCDILQFSSTSFTCSMLSVNLISGAGLRSPGFSSIWTNPSPTVTSWLRTLHSQHSSMESRSLNHQRIELFWEAMPHSLVGTTIVEEPAGLFIYLEYVGSKCLWYLLSVRLHGTTAHKTVIVRSTAMRAFSSVCECCSCNVVIYSLSCKM